MNKKDLFKKALETAGSEGAKINDVVLVNEQQARTIKKEVRSKKAHTYVRPTEFEAFLSKIGRHSFSDMSRELILLAIGQPTDDPQKRNVILKLLKENHDF